MTAIRTTDYVIYLGGSTNAYNSGPGPVGIMPGTGRTARDRELDAIEKLTDGWTLAYNGQYLYARPYARCSAEDVETANNAQNVREMLHAEALAAIR